MSTSLITTEAVAERLSVDPKTVRALVDDGALRAVRIGKRCIRFDPQDVEAFIEGAKACPSTPRAASGTSISSTKVAVSMGRRGKRRAGPLKPLSERDDLKPQPALARTQAT